MPETEVPVKAKPRRRPKSRPKSRPSNRVRRLPPWNVVLVDDDQHTYEYVIDMLGRVFGHGPARALLMAVEVDTRGRAIVFTGHKELAELKLSQLAGFGADRRIAACKGGMTAVLEPAA